MGGGGSVAGGIGGSTGGVAGTGGSVTTTVTITTSGVGVEPQLRDGIARARNPRASANFLIPASSLRTTAVRRRRETRGAWLILGGFPHHRNSPITWRALGRLRRAAARCRIPVSATVAGMTWHSADCAGPCRALAGFVVFAVLAACIGAPLPTEVSPTSTRLTPSATALPPTLTETPTPPVIQGCVTAGSLRVRSGPGKEYPVVGGLNAGDCVPLGRQSSSGEWLMIDATPWEGGSIGWVYVGYVALQADIAFLATSSPLRTTESRAAATYTPTPRKAASTLRPTDTRWPTATRTRAAPTATRRRPTPTSTRWPTATEGPTGGGGGGGGNCHPSYPTVCIPPPPPDLDCGDIPYRRFAVVGSDPHRFDGDNDGIGCESG